MLESSLPTESPHIRLVEESPKATTDCISEYYHLIKDKEEENNSLAVTATRLGACFNDADEEDVSDNHYVYR